jgi:hypothetical protein
MASRSQRQTLGAGQPRCWAEGRLGRESGAWAESGGPYRPVKNRVPGQPMRRTVGTVQLIRSSVLVVLGVGVAAAVVVLLISSGGASGVSQASPPVSKPSSTITGCTPGPRKEDKGTVLFGSVAIPNTNGGEKVQIGRGDDAGTFGAKQPVLVDGTASVVLRLPANAPRSLVMNGYGTNNAKDTMRVVRLHQDSDPCGTLGGANSWAAYAGGFLFKRKQCLRLQVEVDGQKATVPFGLGKSCS